VAGLTATAMLDTSRQAGDSSSMIRFIVTGCWWSWPSPSEVA